MWMEVFGICKNYLATIFAFKTVNFKLYFVLELEIWAINEVGVPKDTDESKTS